jgi:hypothetical protein
MEVTLYCARCGRGSTLWTPATEIPQPDAP